MSDIVVEATATEGTIKENPITSTIVDFFRTGQYSVLNRQIF